jgi:hypothetical protein
MPPARNRFDLAFLASEVSAARLATGFEFFRTHEVLTILQTAFPFDRQIPRSERSRILNASLQHLPPGQVTAQILERAIRDAEHVFLRSTPIRATLATSISFRLPAAVNETSLRSGTIRLARRYPPRIARERARPELRIPEDDQSPQSHSTLLVRTQGRSLPEAFESGLRELDLARASWNLSQNRATLVRFDSEGGQPVNKYRLGRVHTLHDSRSGRSLKEGHWFETAYVAQRVAPMGAAEWQRMERSRQRIDRLLQQHPFRTTLEDGLVRYVRALDSADFEGVLLKLWSILELLADSGGSNYDVLIRRTTFLFQDRKLTQQVLEHLREQRNLVAHGDNAGDHLRALVWQLKRYVEQFFVFHFGLGRELESLQEAATLLDLPAEDRILKAQIKLRRRALRFIS